MRTTLFLAAIVAIGGCAGTKNTQRPIDSSRAVPIKTKAPTLMERIRESRERKAEKSLAAAHTEVSGNLVR
jgi:hypothetical protein